MNHRVTKLLARTDIDADQTKIIEINVKDPITTILFKAELLMPSYLMAGHILETITKIEVIDGSEVLFSLNGQEADALDWYTNGGRFRGNYNYVCSYGTPQRYFALNFGRYLWDKELAFDPTKFSNPALRITFDIDAACDSCLHNYITVWANVFDEQTVSPVGFLMSKEIKNYPTGASTHEYTDLPTDHPYRYRFLRCQYAGTEPSNLIANFKLSEDVDKRVVFDDQPSLVMKNLNPYFPMVKEEWYASLATSVRYIYITPTERIVATGSCWGDTSIQKDYAFVDGDGGKLAAIVANPGHNSQVMVSGQMPHGVWAFPFGDPDKIEEWYDVGRVGSLVADITATSNGAAAKTAQLFLQQLRSY